jgi:hypothetical protein
MRITARLDQSLRTAAANEKPPVTVAKFVEIGLWRYLAQVTGRRGAKFTQRLRYANALIAEVLAVGFPIAIGIV